ncbi:hypothetical protein Q0590_06790 [Rhodocytophaga aerolata]|jgi:hypothetical protein|uniref:DUF5808 domain-containing protein n=1 Tax=Rhodocytophaga aerolata TaxID=455078 RepID=A0ABT8R1H9_9BACT|nr:DUF6728 family protein [Rhodocytophaga aerolata]MDO1445951.1 hypothetical protein [Rhodocytophaga aerolata]
MSKVKEYFRVGEVFGYFFRKKDPSRPTNFNLRMMHGINKISIVMFLLGIVFIIIKKLFA